MKFIFDLDGTLSFDGMTMAKCLEEALLQAHHYGHEVIFATARSYRDCLAILQGDLRQETVIGLNGSQVYQKGRLVAEYSLPKAALFAILDLCQTYNIPYFIDDAFNYAVHYPDKIPFMSFVDPMKLAKPVAVEDMLKPSKAVLALAEHQDVLEAISYHLDMLDSLDLDYHANEQCLYINPKGVTKASTLLTIISSDYVAFGNDQNDIPLFKEALYAVQIGDLLFLDPYADERLPADSQTIAQRLIWLFEKFETNG